MKSGWLTDKNAFNISCNFLHLVQKMLYWFTQCLLRETVYSNKAMEFRAALDTETPHLAVRVGSLCGNCLTQFLAGYQIVVSSAAALVFPPFKTIIPLRQQNHNKSSLRRLGRTSWLYAPPCLTFTNSTPCPQKAFRPYFVKKGRTHKNISFKRRQQNRF